MWTTQITCFGTRLHVKFVIMSCHLCILDQCISWKELITISKSTLLCFVPPMECCGLIAY